MRRSVEVELSVYHKIWAHWRPGETDENDVLKRILSELYVGPGGAVAPPEDKLIEEPTLEGKASEVAQQDGSRTYHSGHRPIRTVGKIRWVDDVIEALRQLGGEGDLEEIYRVVRALRETRGERIIVSLDATVRQAIEAHSSDSESYKGRHDHFKHAGRGRWRLRESD